MQDLTVYNVADYGAKADGVTDNTAAFRRAVEACANAGGGVVYFPAGEYAAAFVELKSGVTLSVEQVRFKMVPDSKAYFFHGAHIGNAAVLGHDVLVGTGGAGGAVEISFGRDIVLDGLEVRDGEQKEWAVVFRNCDGVKILNCTIRNWVKDGIDLVCCRNVVIDRAFIEGVGDDSICLKNEDTPFPEEGYLTENVMISNTVVKDCMHRHPAFKIGTGTAGVFRNIIVHDCIFTNMETVFCIQLMRPTLPGTKERVIENVQLSHIVARNCRYFTDITEMDAERPVIRKIMMDNIVLDGLKTTSRIIGTEEAPVENVAMRSITFGKQAIPPEADLMELKHVNNAIISDWNVDCDCASLLRLTDCRDIRVDKIRAAQDRPILTVEGESSRGIVFDSGGCRAADDPVVLAGEVPQRAVVPAARHVSISRFTCAASISAGSGVSGSVTIVNHGEEGLFEQDITADGKVIHCVRTWLYGGEEKTVEFVSQPLYVPAAYSVEICGIAASVKVTETAADIRMDPVAEVSEENGRMSFRFSVLNAGGREDSRTFSLTEGEDAADQKTLTLAPGQKTELLLSGTPKEGKPLVLPDKRLWEWRLAANTYSRVRTWGDRIEITAGGKLYSASGKLEYERLYEYAAVYKTVKGDFSARFRLVSQEASGQYAAAGIIICSDMTKANACSRIVLHHNAPKYGSMSIFRADCDGDGITEKRSLGSTRIGYWIRVDKHGSRYSGYISPDGAEWEYLESYDVPGDPEIHDVGIYCFANNPAGKPGRAVFEKFGIVPLL